MLRSSAWKFTTTADDLEEGLFGQVLLWVFEILPWLDACGARPVWEIRSRLYGKQPDWCVLPGVLDLAYDAPARAGRQRSLLWARVLHVHALGGDWEGTHALWARFFRLPERIVARADAFGLPARTLGLHYRGTDKNRATLDTNPVAVEDFLAIAAAFLAEHPTFDALFVASDEPGLLALVATRFPSLDVRGLGDVPFHKDLRPGDGPANADRALLDCVLLSRCAGVLKCSSALSGFAKILNPGLACWRVSACKFWSDIPYFPDAYVPPLSLRDPTAQALLDRQFEGDWLLDPRAAQWTQPFVARRRNGMRRTAINLLKYAVSVALGRPRKA